MGARWDVDMPLGLLRLTSRAPRLLRSRLVLGALRSLLALAVLALAVWARSPWTLRLREVEGLLVAGGVVLGLALELRVPSRGLGRARAVALLAAPLFFLSAERALARAKARVLSAPSAQLERLGRHLIVGYTRVDELGALVTRGGVGGVFVTHRNVRGRSRDAVRSELAELRARAPAGRHLFIAADQEGGLVSRLSPMLTPLPALSALVRDGEVDEAVVRAYGRIHARELGRLGVDVNFGPVADLRLHDGLGLLDRHTELEHRAIAADPELVARVTAIYADELAREDVSATLKHFPGLGRVERDTHLFDARLDAPRAELERTDWRPYRAVAGRRDTFVMVGHVVVPAVDPERLATFSPALLGGVLRGELGFEGPIVTDDLAMKPTYAAPGGIGESGVRALQAGADLLLVAYDPGQYYVVMAALLDADDAGRLDHTALAASDRRLGRAEHGRRVMVSMGN